MKSLKVEQNIYVMNEDGSVKGLVKSIDEAYEQLYNRTCAGYVATKKIGRFEMIEHYCTLEQFDKEVAKGDIVFSKV